MTFYYRTTTYGEPQVSEEMKNFWERASQKNNWRIVRLPNGYFQSEIQLEDGTWRDVTRRETIEGAESAIDTSIEHYLSKLEFAKGPTVVKTFE